jgi:hypothetical protein
MKSLRARYKDKSKDIYYAMEEEAKQGKRPSFLKGLRTATREGHVSGLGRPKAAPARKKKT